VSDVEISGGRILGERDAHLGNTGEWGHGIALYGAKQVTVRDIHISRCWGDGISIGGGRVDPDNKREKPSPSEDIVLARVTCNGNRRQGLSIGHSRDVRVYDCEFSDTGGTKPECGIDIEPDPPHEVHRVLIENCRIRGNAGSGIQVFKRVHDVTIRGCTIERNHGYGVLAVAAIDGVIENNDIRDNGYNGVMMRTETRNYRVSRNRFRANATRRRPGAKGAKAPAQSHVKRGENTSEINVVDNQFLDGG
jgi:parallel beta-helix repeat protein